MDWSVYWFMLPVCVVVASIAMFSGISGAALLMPVFLIGFPLIGAPKLTVVAAIGTSLFLETSGFGMGVASYLRRGLVDTRTARSLVAVTLPLGALGALLSSAVPGQALRLAYGALMVVLAWVLYDGTRSHGKTAPSLPSTEGEAREVLAADGTRYAYRLRGLPGQRALSGVGAVLAGMISTGVGEATLPGLVRRSGMPVSVAAATSTVVVAATVVGASAAHLTTLVRDGGLQAIPWNLLVWAVPGAMMGAMIGSRLQGKVAEEIAHRFFALLFLAIGITILAMFTIGRDFIAA